MPESLEQLEQQLTNAEGTETVVILNRIAEHLFRIDPRRGLAHAEEARRGVEIYRQIGDERQTANVLNVAGIIAMATGDHSDALDALKEALEIFRRIDIPFGVSQCLNNMGVCSRRSAPIPRRSRSTSRAETNSMPPL